MNVKLSSGISITSQEPSRIGRTEDGHSISEVLEDKEPCKLGTPTQDGGNSSDTTLKNKCLSTSEERWSWMSKEAEMKKVGMFKLGKRTVQRPRNGLSSMLIRKIRSELEVQTRNSVLISTDHSFFNLE